MMADDLEVVLEVYLPGKDVSTSTGEGVRVLFAENVSDSATRNDLK
jgi:hypothetical protein